VLWKEKEFTKSWICYWFLLALYSHLFILQWIAKAGFRDYMITAYLSLSRYKAFMFCIHFKLEHIGIKRLLSNWKSITITSICYNIMFYGILEILYYMAMSFNDNWEHIKRNSHMVFSLGGKLKADICVWSYLSNFYSLSWEERLQIRKLRGCNMLVQWFLVKCQKNLIYFSWNNSPLRYGWKCE